MGKPKHQLSHLRNEYKGWPAAGAALPASAEHVQMDGLTPERFWRDYICERKPVIISGHLPDAAWKATELWTDEYLTQHAGGAELEVEERGGVGEGYGKGRKVKMAFAECLRRMASGDTSLYLTTQKVATGEDGHPEVLGHPLAELAADFPVQPALLGNLVPQQVNLWAGCAPDGSSTGLHHDYHDNLYVLLRGKKRFRLYPPSWADRMYVHGELRRVHPNGRIVHKSQGEVLADGSDAKDVAQWEARRAAEAELKAAEEAAAAGEEGAAARLAAAEAALDAALDAALEGEAEEGDWDLAADDFDELEALDGGLGAGSDADEEAGGSKKAAAADTGVAGDPDSFSRVDLLRPAAELRKEFPLFPGAEKALVCEVEAGQMLFVPAGWFHEVSSFSAPGCATHMALNFWCHPPDNLEPEAGFAKPYKSDYWPEVWAGRVHKYAPSPAAPAKPEPAPAAVGVEKEAAAEPEEVAATGDGAALGGTPKAEVRPVAAAAAATAGVTPEVLEPLQRGRKRGREEEEDAAAADTNAEPAGPLRKVARLVQGLYGLFGFGRRQFLHRFVTLRGRPQRE